MPVLTPADLETTIRNNIKNTLAQIKQSGVANLPLAINEATDYAAVDFYVDSGRTQLLFSENSIDNPSSFVFASNRVLYYPPDAKLNAASGISTTAAQATYYVTVTFDLDWEHFTSSQWEAFISDEWEQFVADAGKLYLTYNNTLNMLFPSVIVAMTDDPAFMQNSNGIVIVPAAETSDIFKPDDDITYVIGNYTLIVPLDPTLEPDNLDEENRVALADTMINSIRNALYQDRYRGGTCTFKDRNLDGTFVGDYKLDYKRRAMKIPLRFCYQATSASY